MPKEIVMVKVGMTMTEGFVSEWFIADGQQVAKGELLYALETEKVTLDVDAEYSGTVKHAADIGVAMKPGDVVGYIFEAGEEVITQSAVSVSLNKTEPEVSRVVATNTAAVSGPSDGQIKSSPAARRLAKELGVDYTHVSGSGPNGRIIEQDIREAINVLEASVVKVSNPKASPLAKRMAAEKGVDLALVSGTGPGGRIVQADIEAAAADSNQTTKNVVSVNAASAAAAGTSIPITGMRKTIANRMHSSLQNSAQLSMDMEVLMDDAVSLRQSLIQEWQDEGVRPGYTDLVLKAVAKALVTHPMMNSQMEEAQITLLDQVHLGLAVALPAGLVVPVIRNADKLTIKEIAVESARLAGAARDGVLSMDDYADGTFTVTALGMFGVDSFTPIINEPQAGILGVNRIYDGIEWNGDIPVKTKKMNLSLTWDHRVIDGAPAAEFLSEVRDLLSSPYRLLL